MGARTSLNAYQLVSLNIFLLSTIAIKMCLTPLFFFSANLTQTIAIHLILSVVAIILGGTLYIKVVKDRLEWIKEEDTITSVALLVLNLLFFPPLLIFFFMALLFINN